MRIMCGKERQTRRDATHHVARVDVGMIIGTDQPDHLVDRQAVQQVGEAISDGKVRVAEGEMARYISWKASPDVSVRQARAWIGRRDGEQRERDEAGEHFWIAFRARGLASFFFLKLGSY